MILIILCVRACVVFIFHSQLAIIEFILPATATLAAFYSKNKCVHTQDDVTTMTNGQHTLAYENISLNVALLLCIYYISEYPL